MGKVYREFSRQKYNKYKAQFPKLRESEIVSKIIKEWDSLDILAKQNLQTIYLKKNYLTNEDISSSEALVKADLASKEARIAAEKSATKHIKSSFSATRFHSNVKPSSRDGSEFNRGSEQKDDSRLGESSSLQVHVKSRAIAKASKSDYVSFFKHHYQRLTKEHKRWTTQQIASVIKLLWKKKKGDTKTLRRKDGKLRTSKPVSGRRYFRRFKHLTAAEANEAWKRLPFESRNLWTYEATGIHVNNTKVTNTATFGQIAHVKKVLLSH